MKKFEAAQVNKIPTIFRKSETVLLAAGKYHSLEESRRRSNNRLSEFLRSERRKFPLQL